MALDADGVKPPLKLKLSSVVDCFQGYEVQAGRGASKQLGVTVPAGTVAIGDVLLPGSPCPGPPYLPTLPTPDAHLRVLRPRGDLRLALLLPICDVS